MAYERRVVQEIARQGRRRYTRRGSAGGRRIVGSERRKIRSAYQTGITESGLRNLAHGHADSLGWRQERQMYYRNPMNVRASVRRYFNEADAAYDPGDSPAELAQQVQRSAFPSRYAQHRGEGIRLLRKHVLDAGPMGRSRSGGAGLAGNPFTVAGAPGGESAGIGVAALLANQTLARPAPLPQSDLPEPEFTGRRALALPEAYRETPSSPAPVPPPGIAAQLAMVSALRGPDLPNRVTAGGGAPGAPGGFTGRLGYIGDSLGVGTVPRLKALGVRVAADVKGGRGSDRAVGSLRHLLKQGNYGTIVWDLGTNDWTAQTTRESLAKALRLAPNATFVVPTVHGRHAERKNEIIRSLAGPRVRVVDWARRSDPPDGIHPGGAGYERRARMIARAIGFEPQAQRREPGAGRVRGGGGWAGTKNIVLHAVEGMPVSNFKRTPSRNAAVGGSPTSEHLTTDLDSYAADTPHGTGKLIAKRLGIRDWRPGTYRRYTIRAAGGKVYSVQILEDVEGHHDHTHIGVDRVR